MWEVADTANSCNQGQSHQNLISVCEANKQKPATRDQVESSSKPPFKQAEEAKLKLLQRHEPLLEITDRNQQPCGWENAKSRKMTNEPRSESIICD